MSAHTPSDRSLWSDSNESGSSHLWHDHNTIFLMGSCMIVATCVLLGMSWLRDTWLGLPLGLWLIIGAYVVSVLGQPRESRTPFRLGRSKRGSHTGRTSEELDADASMLLSRSGIDRAQHVSGTDPGETSDASDAEHHWVGALGRYTGPIVNPDKPLSTIERILLRAGDGVSWITGLVNTTPIDAGWIIKTLERSGWPERPLRIGLCVRKELSSWILSSDGVCDAQWVRVTSVVSPKRACDIHVLDAVVIEDELGHITLMCPELEGMSAAWQDWSSPLPVSYGNAFALRFDTTDTVLGRANELRAADGPLLRAMIELAAVTSRNEQRLDSRARWRGRRPIDSHGARFDSRVVEACWASLSRAVAGLSNTGRDTEAQKTAARVLSAYLSTTDGSVDLSARREGIELARTLLPDELNIGLRAIAARVASFDDDEAFELASEILDEIRSIGADESTDPWAYLLSELHCAVPSHLALGRLAAGIVLVFGRARLSKMAYLREDLTEDLQHTSWLVDRDADVAMLVQLMRELEAARTSAGIDVTLPPHENEVATEAKRVHRAA